MVGKFNSVDESQHWFRRIVPDRQLQLQPTALRHQVQKSHEDQRSNDLSHELFTGQIISRNKRRKVLQRSRRRKVVIAKDHRNEGSLVASAHASESRQVRPRST
jgi:hypothetical protein